MNSSQSIRCGGPLLTALIACALVDTAHAQPCPVDVCLRIEPPLQIINRDTTPTITVDIVADIMQPVVGWGLDLMNTVPMVADRTGMPAIGGPWFAVNAPDGDHLAALANPFPPVRGSVSGANILLARLTFVPDFVGRTDLLPMITDGDLTEGFPLDATGFGTVSFTSGAIFVVPEPATLLLLLSAVAVRKRLRRRAA